MACRCSMPRAATISSTAASQPAARPPRTTAPTATTPRPTNMTPTGIGPAPFAIWSSTIRSAASWRRRRSGPTSTKMPNSARSATSRGRERSNGFPHPQVDGVELESMTFRQPPEWALHDWVRIGFPSHADLWEDDLEPARAEVITFSRAIHAAGKGERVRLVAADPASVDRASELPGPDIEYFNEIFCEIGNASRRERVRQAV